MRKINKNKLKIIVVMPAYNAAKTLKKTYDEMPKKLVDKTILVDDNSSDNTIEIAKSLGIEAYKHDKNRGYGGNQKTCYKLALKERADIVVMVHPDFQYDTKSLNMLIYPIEKNEYDIVLGTRTKKWREALKFGMPIYKYLGNRFLTFFQNMVLKKNLSEYHTGFRAFRREVLETLPIDKFSNSHIFDQEILVSAISKNFRVGEISVNCRYLPDSSSISFLKSIPYGLSTLILLFRYKNNRLYE